jgi:hypothetical protein
MNFDEVQDAVRSDDSGKWDTLVHREELALCEGKIVLPERCVGDFANQLTPTSWATAQMCGRLSIPTAYFRRCPAPLQDAQANYWLHQPSTRLNAKGSELNSSYASTQNGGGTYENRAYGSGVYESHARGNGVYGSANGQASSQSSQSLWLMRAKENTLRGVLSDRYQKLDNSAFIEHVQPLLDSRLQVKWFALTDESLHLRLVDPTLSREILKDDRVMVGLHISNSEVGKRAVTVDAMVFRLVCSNGLIRLIRGKSLLHQRHIAVSSYQLKLSLEKAMGEALTTAAGLLERMAQSTEEHVDDVESAIEQVRDTWHLSDAFGERVKGALLQEPPSQHETLFGLTNAFTQAAQSLAPDERYGVEVLSGKLLEHGSRVIGSRIIGSKAKAKRKEEPIPAPDRTIIDVRAGGTERMPDHSGHRHDNGSDSQQRYEPANSSERRDDEHHGSRSYGNGVTYSDGVAHNEPLQSTNALSGEVAVTPAGHHAPPPNDALHDARQAVGHGHKLAGIAARRGSAAGTTKLVLQSAGISQNAEGAPHNEVVERSPGEKYANREEQRTSAGLGDVHQQARHMFGGQVMGHSPFPGSNRSSPISAHESVSVEEPIPHEEKPSLQKRDALNEHPSSETQWSLIRAVASRRGLIEYDVLYQIEQRFGKQALLDLTRAEAMSLLQVLQSRSRDELLAPVPEEPFTEEELGIEEGYYGGYSDESDDA